MGDSMRIDRTVHTLTPRHQIGVAQQVEIRETTGELLASVTLRKNGGDVTSRFGTAIVSHYVTPDGVEHLTVGYTEVWNSREGKKDKPE